LQKLYKSKLSFLINQELNQKLIVEHAKFTESLDKHIENVKQIASNVKLSLKNAQEQITQAFKSVTWAHYATVAFHFSLFCLPVIYAYTQKVLICHSI
jgi:hypothetical protein